MLSPGRRRISGESVRGLRVKESESERETARQSVDGPWCSDMFAEPSVTSRAV